MKNFNLMILLFLSGITFSVLPDNFSSGQTDFDVQVINLTELEKIISERYGKPLLINVWATWCVPCREEFPDLISFAGKHQEIIDVIGISVDFPNEIESKVIPFLDKYNPGFPNYVIDVNDPEKLINFLSDEWSGAIPATFYFSSEGVLINSIVGKSNLSSFEELIRNE